MNDSTPSAPDSYTFTAKALHWLMAALLLALFICGVYMSDLKLSPQKLQLYSWHKWAGITALLLVALRLLWRASHPAPALPASMSPLTQKLAALGHVALYLLMLAIPLSGWLMSSAKGFPVVWFGVLPLPDLVAKNEMLGEILKEVHEGLNVALLVLVIGHILAALKHHFIDRDDILLRMSFRSRRSV